jgi:hypothetical protein
MSFIVAAVDNPRLTHSAAATYFDKATPPTIRDFYRLPRTKRHLAIGAMFNLGYAAHAHGRIIHS